LPDKIEINGTIFNLEKCKVEVKYHEVDQKVEEIWKKNPHLVIHVGVHGHASKIKLEKCATNGFFSCDYSSKTLCEPIVCLENSGKCQVLETRIDADRIAKVLNDNHRDMFETSCDVGQYLCGYIYMRSLDKDPTRTLFVHVPCIDKPFSSKETSDAIFKILEQCLVMPLLN
jgi:pyroglutamyl-peptidase